MAAIRSGYPSKRTSVWHEIRKHYVLLLFVLLPLIHIMLFCYKPMYGVILAFKKYDFGLGIWGSKWVGLKHFQKFFKSYRFEQMLTNTLVINIYALLLSVPLPMGLALVLHYVNGKRLSKATQMITYAPHFISNVVMVSMLSLMLAKGSGVVNGIFRNMGLEAVDFLGKPALFKHLYVWSDVWQHNGWQAIIYIATLSSVPPELYEAAVIDGAVQIHKATSGNSSDSACGSHGDLFFSADDGMLAGRSSGNTFAAYDYMGRYPCIPARELDAGTHFHGSSICRYGTSRQRIIRRCEVPVDQGKRTGSIQKNGPYASGQGLCYLSHDWADCNRL